jgi:DNA repair exonuclease SbcCD ATPase subunit
MDLTQLSQMVSWLDEEHRRDREELAKLDQRMQGLVIENQEQSRRIQDLESRLANTQAQLTRFTQIEQALQQLKNEVTVMMARETEARLQGEREQERMRVGERETVSRSIAEIRKELPRFGRIEEELVTRQAEDQRLGEMVLMMRQSISNVSKDLDERTRTLPYMVEQRAQDNKRIAQVQAEVVELYKRTDPTPGKFAVLEERIQRLERDIQKVIPVPDQLRGEQAAFIEAQKLTDAERTRQMAVWDEAFAEQRKVIEAQVVRLREFQAQHEASQRALRALDEFQSAVVRDQKQVAELQRLAEERQRKEFTDWQAENEQRWKKEILRWDYQAQEQQKINQKLADRFPPIERVVAWLERELESVWQLQQTLGAQQMQETQHMLEAVGKAVGARPRKDV